MSGRCGVSERGARGLRQIDSAEITDRPQSAVIPHHGPAELPKHTLDGSVIK
jgi:hypothetical protein